MLKRKLYPFALGTILAQLSIAQFWDGNSAIRISSKIGCAACGRASQRMELPALSESIVDVAKAASRFVDPNLSIGENLLQKKGGRPSFITGQGATVPSWTAPTASQPEPSKIQITVPEFRFSDRTMRYVELPSTNPITVPVIQKIQFPGPVPSNPFIRRI